MVKADIFTELMHFQDMRKIQIVIKYVWYKLTSRHRHGHGLHSPFMFRLVSEVIYGKTWSVELEAVMKWHKSLKKNREKIPVGSFGAGSHTGGKSWRRISGVTANSSIHPKYGRLLYRLTQFVQPAEILELGTGLGISTAYLRAGAQNCRMITVEGHSQKSDFAKEAFRKQHFPETQFVNSDFDEFLDSWKPENHPMMLFIDGDHSYEATMRYYNRIASYIRHDTVLVLDDIHWSEGMERAWKSITSDRNSVLTADLFFTGLVFFREGVNRQDFIINF